MNKKSPKKIKWIFEVSKRFSRVDRKGRSAATSRLAAAGICFGVMTLIVTMSIMNGFQLNSIEPLMEISSYHLRIENLKSEEKSSFMETCNSNKEISFATEFYEAQTMMTGSKGKESVAIVRAVSPEIFTLDSGFKKQIKNFRGSFRLENPDSIILGSTLARNLGVGLGSQVTLLVLSGGNDVDLFSADRVFTVTGIFSTTYGEINSGYCFVNLDAAEKNFGEGASEIIGIKLQNSQKIIPVINQLSKDFPQSKITTWKEYNKSFFGVLRIEKNVLFLLVALIFVVVAINIYNGMRRLVFERKSEIAILSALGAKASEIKTIFIMRGFITGFTGAIIGLVLGLLISFNSHYVFVGAAKVLYFFQYIFTAIFNHKNLMFIHENSSYILYSTIPARVFGKEVVFITLFGILAPVFASLAASKNVLKLTVAEVLHNE